MRPSNLAFPELPMAANMRQSAIALPKGWLRRVRSAVIHSISLAQTSLTHARSVAANSINVRIRLKEENERLEGLEEIAPGVGPAAHLDELRFGSFEEPVVS